MLTQVTQVKLMAIRVTVTVNAAKVMSATPTVEVIARDYRNSLVSSAMRTSATMVSRLGLPGSRFPG